MPENTTPTIVKIGTTLKFHMEDGSVIEQDLKSVPQEGVEATFNWVSSQTKPNPEDPSGPPWNKWQNSATDTPIDIACNFADELILLQIKQIVSVCPPASVVAAKEDLAAAEVAYQESLKKACGLVE